jgi:phosphoesterase RecJ-like protein
MPGNEEVMIYTEHTEEAAVLIADADIIFCLDFNNLSRINEMGELVDAKQRL